MVAFARRPLASTTRKRPPSAAATMIVSRMIRPDPSKTNPDPVPSPASIMTVLGSGVRNLDRALPRRVSGGAVVGLGVGPLVLVGSVVGTGALDCPLADGAAKVPVGLCQRAERHRTSAARPPAPSRRR